MEALEVQVIYSTYLTDFSAGIIKDNGKFVRLRANRKFTFPSESSCNTNIKGNKQSFNECGPYPTLRPLG